jgi:putative ABC transport system permease protein
MSKDFLILMIPVAVIATPVAWYLPEHGLRDFTLLVQISWYLFAMARVSALLIFFATAGLQAWNVPWLTLRIV